MRRLLLKHLHRAERLSENVMHNLLSWRHSGFSVFAGPQLETLEFTSLESQSRCITRPASWDYAAAADLQRDLFMDHVFGGAAKCHLCAPRLGHVGQGGRFMPFYGGIATLDGGSTKSSVMAKRAPYTNGVVTSTC